MHARVALQCAHPGLCRHPPAQYPFDSEAPSPSHLSSSPHSSFARTADPGRPRPTDHDRKLFEARRSPLDPQARTVAEAFRPDLPITAARAAACPRPLLHFPTPASVRLACSSSPQEHSIEWAPHAEAPAVERLRVNHRLPRPLGSRAGDAVQSPWRRPQACSPFTRFVPGSERGGARATAALTPGSARAAWRRIPSRYLAEASVVEARSADERSPP